MDINKQHQFKEECKLYFQKITDAELVEIFNSGLGIRAWGIARSIHVNSLISEMHRRDWDISAIENQNVIHLSIEYHCTLDSKKLVLTSSIK